MADLDWIWKTYLSFISIYTAVVLAAISISVPSQSDALYSETFGFVLPSAWQPQQRCNSAGTLVRRGLVLRLAALRFECPEVSRT
jgi:hypothetical protein